jgi:CRISPR/Cas system CSM-associated protein Csm2 small subunit
MDKSIEAILSAIQELVDDDDTNWTVKRDRILKKLKDDESRETAFEEFTSWFEAE